MMRASHGVLGLLALAACGDNAPRARVAALTVADAMGGSPDDDAAFARATAPPTLCLLYTSDAADE